MGAVFLTTDSILSDWRLWLAMFAIMGAAVRFLRHWFLKQAAQNWPMVSATVENFYTANSGSRDAAHWIPVLGYSYEIDGQRYCGNFGLGSYASNDKTIAEEAGDPWRGQKIMVRYNPQKPEKSAFLVADGAPRGIICYADLPPASPDIITLSLK